MRDKNRFVRCFFDSIKAVAARQNLSVVVPKPVRFGSVRFGMAVCLLATCVRLITGKYAARDRAEPNVFISSSYDEAHGRLAAGLAAFISTAEPGPKRVLQNVVTRTRFGPGARPCRWFPLIRRIVDAGDDRARPAARRRHRRPVAGQRTCECADYGSDHTRNLIRRTSFRLLVAEGR